MLSIYARQSDGLILKVFNTPRKETIMNKTELFIATLQFFDRLHEFDFMPDQEMKEGINYIASLVFTDDWSHLDMLLSIVEEAREETNMDITDEMEEYCFSLVDYINSMRNKH